jgi:hypothetical protein
LWGKTPAAWLLQQQTLQANSKNSISEKPAAKKFGPWPNSRIRKIACSKVSCSSLLLQAATNPKTLQVYSTKRGVSCFLQEAMNAAAISAYLS